MTELRPGTSPPPVRMPMRRGAAMGAPLVAGRGRCCPGWLRTGRAARGRRDATRVRGNPSAGPVAMIRSMNYELFMGEALAEARQAAQRGAPAVGAIAVMNEAMVARGSNRVARRTIPPRTPSSAPSGRPPASSGRRASRTSRSSPPSSRARCAWARCWSATSRRWCTRCPTRRRRGGQRAPARPAPGARRGASRSCRASAATRPRSSTPDLVGVASGA